MVKNAMMSRTREARAILRSKYEECEGDCALAALSLVKSERDDKSCSGSSRVVGSCTGAGFRSLIITRGEDSYQPKFSYELLILTRQNDSQKQRTGSPSKGNEVAGLEGISYSDKIYLRSLLQFLVTT